jgi:DDE superfamily endonuclease
MEDVLDLYAEPPDPQHPVVCIDESLLRRIGETRPPLPAAPGRLARVDSEYRRCGTVNRFAMLDAHRRWRRVEVSEQRAACDFARCLREPVDVESEIGALKGQCLNRRIDDRQHLAREIAAWERQRNAAGVRITWMFTTGEARTKLGRAYPNAATLDQPVKPS